MIIRIVKMTFDPARIEMFLEIFNKSRNEIAAMPGCLYLELWKDVDCPNSYVTHSHWESVEALDAYRESAFFGKIWKETKAMFIEKPVAFSVERVPV